MAGHDVAGLFVMHRCDNPACFRYDHLVIGTNADNVADREAKGRGRKGLQTPITHGTEGGYNQHLRYGLEPCAECRASHAEYRRERRVLRPVEITPADTGSM